MADVMHITSLFPPPFLLQKQSRNKLLHPLYVILLMTAAFIGEYSRFRSEASLSSKNSLIVLHFAYGLHILGVVMVSDICI